MTTSSKYTVGVAGTTSNTQMCAQGLLENGNFEVIWALTPPPQPFGRKQEVKPNFFHQWCEDHSFPVHFVEKKITPELEAELVQPDFLLVVDFGYLIPKWLLKFPKIAPVNIHPSALPKWRGSSPGQFVLLYGEKESAQTIMVMGEGMDTGPILWQKPFVVEPGWTQTEYYFNSFNLARQHIGEVLVKTATGQILPIPQPIESPTLTARRLKKDDGFVAWRDLATLADIPFPSDHNQEETTSQLLLEVEQTGQPLSQVISQAVRALYPWPGVWTLLPTKKGLKRMKILAVSLKENTLELETVQVEGQQPAKWKEVLTLYSFLSA